MAQNQQCSWSLQWAKIQGQIIWLRSKSNHTKIYWFEMLRSQIICPCVCGHCIFWFLDFFNTTEFIPFLRTWIEPNRVEWPRDSRVRSSARGRLETFISDIWYKILPCIKWDRILRIFEVFSPRITKWRKSSCLSTSASLFSSFSIPPENELKLSKQKNFTWRGTVNQLPVVTL